MESVLENQTDLQATITTLYNLDYNKRNYLVYKTK